MNIKLRDIQPGQRFKLHEQNCVRIAHAESVGLDPKFDNRRDGLEETVWFFNLDDSTVNYAARHSRFEYLLDVDVELHPFDAGYNSYGTDEVSPYHLCSPDDLEWDRGWTKAYQDDFDYSYDRLSGGL